MEILCNKRSLSVCLSDMIDQNMKIRTWNFDSTFSVAVRWAISHTINPGVPLFQ